MKSRKLCRKKLEQTFHLLRLFVLSVIVFEAVPWSAQLCLLWCFCFFFVLSTLTVIQNRLREEHALQEVLYKTLLEGGPTALPPRSVSDVIDPSLILQKQIQELTIKESVNSQWSLYITHVQSNAIQYNTSGINPTLFEDYIIQFSRKYVNSIICSSLMSK